MQRLSACAAALALAVPLAAETTRGTASTTVGGKKVTIDYGRPALKGRSLDELTGKLGPERIWRAGENQVTTLVTEADLVIGGQPVPAGKYSVYVHAPEQGAWGLVINSDLGVPLGQIWDKAPENMKNEPWPWLTDYGKNVAAKEVARAEMKAGTAEPVAEQFTIAFEPAGEGATLVLSWGARRWSIGVAPAP
jgi:hypothetical protein